MCAHPFLLKRVHDNNDYVTTEEDKQKEEAEKELRGSKGYICGGVANDEECTNVRRRFDAQNKERSL
jgi:hypothetical protein